MENILQALLTDKAARSPKELKNLALSQETFQPWATEPPL